MIKYDLHTHTTYCDGKSSVFEMVEAAEEKGLDIIGISGHEYAPMQEDFCMSIEDTQKYIDDINKLKKSSKIKVYLGIERDYYSTETEYEYDYVIGSVHSIYKNGEYLSVDHSEITLKQNVEKHYDGNYLEYVKDYYSLVKDVVRKTKCDIVGHFDLVCKFNEGNKFFDENSDEYKAIALDAAEAIVESGKYVEINTGAVHRGYRTRQYPDDFLVEFFKSKNVKLIFSSDSHSKETLCFDFDKVKNLTEK